MGKGVQGVRGVQGAEAAIRKQFRGHRSVLFKLGQCSNRILELLQLLELLELLLFAAIHLLLVVIFL